MDIWSNEAEYKQYDFQPRFIRLYSAILSPAAVHPGKFVLPPLPSSSGNMSLDVTLPPVGDTWAITPNASWWKTKQTRLIIFKRPNAKYHKYKLRLAGDQLRIYQ